MLNVIIPEPIPSLNKGELAILEGLRESLNVHGKYNLTVYSPPQWYEDDIRNADGKYNVVSGVDLFDLGNVFREKPAPRTRMNFFKTWGMLLFFASTYRFSKRMAHYFFKDPLLNSIANSDLILANHDGMLSYLHFYLTLAARIMGKKVALFGGSNDLKGRSGFKTRKFFQYAIRFSVICTVRDPGIKNYLIKNDVPEEKIHLFPDPAVLLKPCKESRTIEILNKEYSRLPEEKPLYGLIPVRGGIVFNKSFSDVSDLKTKHELRVKLWVDALNFMAEKTDAHFLFLPHCIGPGKNNDDRRMSRDVYKLLEQKERFTLIKNEYSANELKGIINKCEFVLGERTHGLIGSVSAATPCIAFTAEEDLRMHYIMENMFGRKTYDLNNPNTDEIKKLLLNEWDNRAEIEKEMSVIAERVITDAYRAADMLKEAINSRY